MKKISVIGCPGSGKSTFSISLKEHIHIPIYHLDMIYWNLDGTHKTRKEFRNVLQDIFKKDSWILDGNYNATMEERIKESDTVVFLDYPLEVCLSGIANRKGKERKDIACQTLDEEDEIFLEFVKNYNEESKPKILELLEKYKDKNIIVFKNREEAENFLSTL